ncbi:diaminopimelate decarboxylase [Aureibacter tunicatorum]|uniref:Diaminopimelate decarboxylase n=1 Tax=Aureibacter tunicatorum TaxID=866807 RepID=A0AAE3XU39_9BACT|nr:diaminopimelate decarboxylase [Aureibacter tunicatorum]MDR6241994.1 diaminopimelate decarboxylase [Aureibacter tunicatorum]BDD07273.1 diaminopimelate decarboxylase [Aureibacter tunicatorum]
MKRVDNHFEIQGIKVDKICQEFGTPLYVYDADTIVGQLSKFRKAFEGVDFKVKYACKALTNLSIVKLMKTLGTGLDTVSIPEVKMGLSVGFEPEEIIFTPNAVDFSEIEEAVELGVHINIENMSNLERFAKKYGNTKPCCVRMNPFIMAESNSEKVEWWHKQSKFGISIKQIDDVKELVKEYGLVINGIHIHSSSVIMNPEIFIKGVQNVFEVAERFENLDYIDFGGGIKVLHKEDDEIINIFDLGKGLKEELAKFEERYGKKVQLWFEPGRFLVSDSGTLFTEVKIRKNNGHREFAGTDSGFNQLIRPMMYDAYHEIVNTSNPDGEEQMYTIVGNICEIDNFAVDRNMPEIREGDILAIKNAGAYGYSMASNYNSRMRPAEVMIVNGEAKLVRKRDTYEDLVKNQIVIDFDKESLDQKHQELTETL